MSVELRENLEGDEKIVRMSPVDRLHHNNALINSYRENTINI